VSRSIHIVANPAAGQESLDIKALNKLFLECNIDWDISFTKSAGDAKRMAEAAADAGVDVIAAYGGDGTVAEAASGLIGRDIPFGIIPGGTANVMSVELGIPTNLLQACQLFCEEELTVRPVDVGEVGDRHFLLRLSVGIEAKMVEGADRALKDRLGLLAYGLSALRAIADPVVSHYRFVLDGKVFEEEGIACIVANSGNLGLKGLRLAPTIDVSDGLLDVVLVNQANISTVGALIASILGQDVVESADSFEDAESRVIRHWQAKEIEIQTEPADSVQCDGEMIGSTPKSIRVLAGALKVVTPLSVLENGFNGR
jgi:diacylglycerol kinase (ATP)